MAKITLQGTTINTNADILKTGIDAPEFTLVDSDLKNIGFGPECCETMGNSD